MRKKWYIIAPIGIAAVALFIGIGGEIVLQLWNWLLPALFGWRQITFWQAIGILALCRILFGGLGGHGSHRSGIRSRMADRMATRRENMTPEERERFRQGMQGRCGVSPSTSESGGQ